MVTTVNIPVEGYILLIECRAKLAIIKSYIRSGNACYEDEKFLKCVLGMEEISGYDEASSVLRYLRRATLRR